MGKKSKRRGGVEREKTAKDKVKEGGPHGPGTSGRGYPAHLPSRMCFAKNEKGEVYSWSALLHHGCGFRALQDGEAVDADGWLHLKPKYVPPEEELTAEQYRRIGCAVGSSAEAMTSSSHPAFPGFSAIRL